TREALGELLERPTREQVKVLRRIAVPKQRGPALELELVDAPVDAEPGHAAAAVEQLRNQSPSVAAHGQIAELPRSDVGLDDGAREGVAVDSDQRHRTDGRHGRDAR